nr:putative retrotransposon protein [Tanacetum cinerariifolium]
MLDSKPIDMIQNLKLELRVNCYCDAGFETDRDDTKSQTGYVFILNGGAVVWKSSKQSTTAQHATEAEYIAVSEAVKEAVWIRKFIDELGVVPSNDYPIKMNCNNSTAIIMAKESGIQKRARHFKIKYHYVRECIETGEVDIVKVHTDDNLADLFTKALAGPKLTRHARSIANEVVEGLPKAFDKLGNDPNLSSFPPFESAELAP